ncbi:MAG: beta-ketoacyl-ACP synthase II [Oscillospiraceae bacterium]|nr:beta-ketoacyl-ACP synthase II [Oscillospiraceae bacterium]
MNRRVAVTGMGAITPLGNDVPAFWDALKAGKCGIGRITKFDPEPYKVKIAAEVHDFDPLQYMSKADAQHSDPYARLAIAAASQAVEDSGVEGTVEAERFGVYIGTGIGGIATFMTEHQKLLEGKARRVSPFFIPMMIANMAASMISMRYGCKAMALPAVTACASGGNAIGEAMRAIRHGYADVMIAGGAEATVNELALAGFINMQALSTAEDPLAACLPFDRRRGGFVMGEGGGALVLEEYDRAVARGATIYCELCGYGSTSDAYHMTAPDPKAEGATRVIADAVRESGLDTDKIYINAHGTGTKLNDACETLAVKQALGEERAHKAVISSTKSMTGHMLGAAGAVEAIAAIKTLTEGIVPPTIGLTDPDPELDLDYTPLTARPFQPELALSSSLGFGGHNACLAFKRV